MVNGVRAIMIVEIAGRPAEHVKSALKDHVERLKGVKGVSEVSIQISDPKELDRPEGVEVSQGMFSCFAEVEFSVENFSKLTEIVFDFMPSSVELLEPSRVDFDLSEATAFLNNVSGRMHRYDEIAKIAQIQSQQVMQRMQLMEQEIMKRDAERKIPKKEKKVSKKKVSKKK